MKNIAQIPIVDIAEKIKERKISSVSVTQHFLDVIKKHNGKVNAVIQKRDDDEILSEAENADEDLRNGNVRGPLHGVPITIKDVLHVQGYRMSRGMKEFLGPVSAEDATVVSRLRLAGAIILGITNVPELCMSFETSNLLYGTTSNPHNLEHSAGGSSGGEAAAIAAGMTPAGLASDAGGSIRIPAAFNGICGLKLSQGRVPLSGQYPAERAGLFHHTSSFGVMGRYVSDLEIMGKIIIGSDRRDPETVDVPWITNPEEVGGLRVAILYDTDRIALSTAVRAAMESTVGLIKKIVRHVEEDTPDDFQEASEVLWRLFISGGDKGKGWKELFASIGKNEFSDSLKGFISMCENVDSSKEQVKLDWIAMDQFRFKLAKFFRSYDLLITPTFPTTAFKHEQSLLNRHLYGFVFPFSLSGSPVLALPIGVDPQNGLPIGIQIIAPKWSENRLIQFGKHLEAALPCWKPANL